VDGLDAFIYGPLRFNILNPYDLKTVLKTVIAALPSLGSLPSDTYCFASGKKSFLKNIDAPAGASVSLVPSLLYSTNTFPPLVQASRLFRLYFTPQTLSH
jgi:hypothetical protein